MTELTDKLSAPFDPTIVSWRVGPTTKDKTKGMALAYIDARDVMRRLDEVCGPENWQDEYPWSDGKRVVCRIGIRVERYLPENDGRDTPEWVWKTDGAGDTDTEGEKGALSDAFKRAAVKWGIGRYLYDVDTPWVQIEQRGNSYAIPDAERTKLVAVLRRQFPANAPLVVPRLWQQGVAVNDAATTLTKEQVIAAKNRLKDAIEDAKHPQVIDDLIRINGHELGAIRDYQESLYTGLMAFATGRKTELLASMG